MKKWEKGVGLYDFVRVGTRYYCVLDIPHPKGLYAQFGGSPDAKGQGNRVDVLLG
jgi:hypothetical protein